MLHDFYAKINEGFSTLIMKYIPKDNHYYSTLSLKNIILIYFRVNSVL